MAEYKERPYRASHTHGLLDGKTRVGPAGAGEFLAVLDLVPDFPVDLLLACNRQSSLTGSALDVIFTRPRSKLFPHSMVGGTPPLSDTDAESTWTGRPPLTRSHLPCLGWIAVGPAAEGSPGGTRAGRRTRRRSSLYRLSLPLLPAQTGCQGLAAKS